MNRRGFFLGMAAAALCATTRLYGLASLPYQGRSRFSWDKGLQVADNMTLAEWAKNNDEYGYSLVKILEEQNEILKDVVFVSGDPGPFRMTIKTPLPEVAWT